MRTLLLILGLGIIGIGIAGKMMLTDRYESFSFLQGGLSLGGALLICYGFSLKNYWLGVIGSGIVALLGFCRAMANLPQWVEWLSHSAPRPPASPLLEMIVAVATLFYMIKVIQLLYAEKQKRLLADEEDHD